MSDFIFKEEPEEKKNTNLITSHKKWRILVVDDDDSVHQITKLVLADAEIENRHLDITSVYSMEEAKKMAANLYPNFGQRIWIRITKSYRMLQYVASEISWFLLIALMFKTLYDLVKCGLLNLFLRPKKTSVKDKMDALGISEEALELIKKRIQ